MWVTVIRRKRSNRILIKAKGSIVTEKGQL